MMTTKIEKAIADAKLHLKATEKEIMILARVRTIQQQFVDTLEVIDNDKLLK